MDAKIGRQGWTRRDLFMLASGLGAVLAVGCKVQRAEDETPNGSSATTAKTVRPDDPVDESFRGCQKSCGVSATRRVRTHRAPARGEAG